jgi:hypothetical protein
MKIINNPFCTGSISQRRGQIDKRKNIQTDIFDSINLFKLEYLSGNKIRQGKEPQMSLKKNESVWSGEKKNNEKMGD